MTDNANVFLAPKEINSEAEKQKLKASKKLNYDAQLQKEFSGIIDELNLSKLQKEFLRCRWLEQILGSMSPLR
jgi:hypothetical protein